MATVHMSQKDDYNFLFGLVGKYSYKFVFSKLNTMKNR